MARYRSLATNRRATFDYDIQDRILAGIVLQGSEVKSIRAGRVSLKGAFANFKADELWVSNMHVSPYPPANENQHEPDRARKLLLHKKQLVDLQSRKSAGLNIVVCSIGVSGPYIKVELGVGPGKKHHDKRETIKRRQADRDAARAIRRRAGS